MHMMSIKAELRVVPELGTDVEADRSRLDNVFFALSDPIRRALLQRLDGQSLLVSELAAPFDISLQAISRHIQVLVRAGLIRQERSGRISRCSLDAGPLCDASMWINRYSKYWQEQFGVLAAALEEIEEQKPRSASRRKRRRRRTSARPGTKGSR